jgi:hypothetical protein
MNIEKITDMKEMPAHDWAPVYFSEVSGARNRFTVKIFATAPGTIPATSTSEFTVNLLFNSGSGYVAYSAQFPPPATGITGKALALRNPNSYSLAIVKSGYGVADVFVNPDASFMLAAGQQTNSVQMEDIFKSQTPGLPIQILAVPVLSIDSRLVAYIPIVVKAEIKN